MTDRISSQVICIEEWREIAAAGMATQTGTETSMAKASSLDMRASHPTFNNDICRFDTGPRGRQEICIARAREREVNHDSYEPGLIREILANTKRIAMLGASPNAARPSNGVLRFLLDKGYDVVPVNPGHSGHTIHGQTVVASLADIAGPVDMVDVFRAADQLPAIVDEVLAMPVRPKVIWCQLGVRDDEAARKAEQAGITVIMNRCPAIEYPHLLG